MEAEQLTEDRRERRGAALIGILLAGIVALSAVDVISDFEEGTTLEHVLIEVLVLAASLLALGTVLTVIVRRSRALRREAASLATRLKDTRAEAERWRSEARDLLDGLSDAIDRQFGRWKLSAAEKETALLLLKGLSHKEIAGVRGVTPATARQQARAIYRKGGLDGRHELSAFFLDELVLPRDQQELPSDG